MSYDYDLDEDDKLTLTLIKEHFVQTLKEQPLTNEQMGGSEAQKVLRKCRALVGIDLVLVFQPCECAAGPVCYGVSS